MSPVRRWLLHGRRRPPDLLHVCAAPTSPGGIPAGKLGHIWRCPICRTVWRLGHLCDTCDVWGARPHPGMHDAGAAWRSTTFWQWFLGRLFRPVGDP